MYSAAFPSKTSFAGTLAPVFASIANNLTVIVSKSLSTGGVFV